MLFDDDKEIENNNFDFSPEENAKSISWDDLVNEDDEVDLSDILADSSKESEKDDEKENEIEPESEEIYNVNSQEQTFDDTKEDVVNLSSPDFNLNDAANSYVNSLELSETVVDPDNFGEQGEMVKFGSSEENQNQPEANEPSLSGFDSDILSMLDNNQSENSDTISSITFNKEPQEDLETAHEDSYNKETEEVYPETPSQGVYPQAKKGISSRKLILVAALAFVGIIVVLLVLSSRPKYVKTEDIVTIRSERNGEIIEVYVPREFAEKENKRIGGTIIDDSPYRHKGKDAGPMPSPAPTVSVSGEPAPKAKPKPNESKLTVVSLSYGGRKNPFMPSGTFGLGISASDLSSPPDIDADDPEAVEARKLLSIKVTGIIFDSAKPSAIVNFDKKDYFVQKGDRIDTYYVSKITRDTVSVANKSNVYTARVGEEFILDYKIPESKQMKIDSRGHRQYISSDDIQISTK